MCGICGVVSTAVGVPEAGALRAMNQRLVHRGPDDEGFFNAAHVGLGMRRLSVIDLAGGAQPIFNEDRSIAVVCNGEIYNFRALRGSLSEAGHRFTTRSDTEVIAHAYEAYGEDCVSRLRGMFALALWDAPRAQLLLARDRLGIKPLYYARTPQGLAFASELKALLAHPDIRRELDPEAVDCYFTYGYVPSPRSILKGIAKLEPGTCLTWSRGDVRLRRYWRPDYTRKVQKMGFAEGARELRRRLREAVQSHLVSDVPLGAFLSGGVDSSAVVALMKELGHAPLKTFALGFAGGGDELPYARQVARHLGTEHHELVAEPEMMGLLPQLVWSQDEPLFDNSMLPTFLVSRLARQHVTVALSGDGGDELFAGYEWTRRHQFVRRYQHAPQALRRILEGALLGPGYAPGYERGWWHQARRFLVDGAQGLEAGFARRTTVSRQFREAWYAPALRDRLGHFDAAQVQRAAFEQARVAQAEEAMLAVDAQLFLPEDCLAKVDRMSMAHSLEVRVPLLDHELFEFAARLPWEWKMSGTTTKRILKAAMADALPPAVLRQRKQGFTLPLGRWLRGPSGQAAARILLDDTTARRGVLAPQALRALWQAHQRGTHELSSRLWQALVFEVWARLYLDRPGAAAPDSLEALA